MVGGERAIYGASSPFWTPLEQSVLCRAIGARSVCKLVHNMISHGIRQAIAGV
jgi:hypothetical protein